MCRWVFLLKDVPISTRCLTCALNSAEANVEEVVEEVVKKPKKSRKKKYPEMETVVDSEGRKVTGFISGDGKSITDVAGVTFAL